MNANPLDLALDLVRGPAMDRLSDLMGRIKMAQLTPAELCALLAIFEAADARVNVPAAAVFTLHTDGRCER